jgi:hypothetical protein
VTVPKPSFLHDATQFLNFHAFVPTVACSVILLFFLFPAYKRFRTKGLMFLSISSALIVFSIVFDRLYAPHPSDDLAVLEMYFFLHTVASYAALIFSTVGVLLFLRDYVRLAEAARTAPPKDHPQA